MRILYTLAVSVLFLSACDNAETSKSESQMESNPTNIFNPTLAKDLGADDYGMKPYVMAFLKRGPNRDRSEEEAMALQRAHLDNIKRMAEEGKLVLAGPFLDDSDVRGIYIFDVRTVEEARELTETDPAIQAGQLVMELRPWYGSAALLKVNEIHAQLASKPI